MFEIKDLRNSFIYKKGHISKNNRELIYCFYEHIYHETEVIHLYFKDKIKNTVFILKLFNSEDFGYQFEILNHKGIIKDKKDGKDYYIELLKKEKQNLSFSISDCSLGGHFTDEEAFGYVNPIYDDYETRDH